MLRNITYSFTFPEDSQENLEYSFAIDEKTLSFVSLSEDKSEKDSAWSDLDFCKCDNCPLSLEDHKKCPVASNLFGLVNFFKNFKSYENSNIIVKTPERNYSKKTSVQEGLFSIFGLIMATSNCPHMSFFKPLAMFHLPFANDEETVFRSLSTFALKNYFQIKKDNKKKSFDLDDIHQIYKEISIVNKGILERINQIDIGDADKNAIVILDAFCTIISMEKENKWNTIVDLFEK